MANNILRKSKQGKVAYEKFIVDIKIYISIILEYSGMNLPRLDPLRIDSMDIEQGGRSPINVIINLKNVDLLGLSDALMLELKYDKFQK